MKDIRLLTTAFINGVPRSPVEGLQTVSDEEAKRLIDAGQAEDAAADVERGESATSDGLDKTRVADLRALAEKEGVTIEGDANKATIIDAIRRHRNVAAGVRTSPQPLDGLDEAALREVATSEGVTLDDGLDEDGIRAAIETRPTAV